jgi:hypothetical protein
MWFKLAAYTCMRKLVPVLIPVILFLFSACGNTDTKAEKHNEKRELVPNPEGKAKENFAMEDNAASEDRWHFKKYLNNPATPKLAKDVFHNNWNLTSYNDGELLSFLEKLTDKNKEARPFYFKVVTNSAKKADGAFSEGLSNAGYEYVQNNTSAFTSYFVGLGAFSNEDLKIWSDIVLGELEITSENDQGQYDKNSVNQYINSLYKNCTDCSAEQKKVLDRFGLYMKKEWSRFLKSNEKSE